MPRKKKKNKPQAQKPFTPESYLTSGKARKLPIYECLVESGWQSEGWFILSVARKHVNENITFAAFFIDLQCVGIKEVINGVNVAPEEYQEWKTKLENDQVSFETCDYNLAHNIIYEAVSYADQWGIEPHKGFSLAQFILAEDDDSIPLMEIPVGVEDMPKLIYDTEDPRNDYYLQQLQKHAGQDNYQVAFGDEEDEEDDEIMEEMVDTSAWKQDEWRDFLNTADLERLDYTPNIIENIFEKELNANSDLYRNLWNSLLSEVDHIDYDRNDPHHFHPSVYQDYKEAKAIIANTASKNDLETGLKKLDLLRYKYGQHPEFQYLFICGLQRANHMERADDLLSELHRKNPNFATIHLAYLSMLVRNDEAVVRDEFVNQPITLKSILPGGTAYNVYEYVQFLVLMCEYFYKKDKLGESFLYRNLLYEIDAMRVPLDLSPDIPMFNKIDLAVAVHVKSLISTAQTDAAFMEKLVELLATNDTIFDMDR